MSLTSDRKSFTCSTDLARKVFQLTRCRLCKHIAAPKSFSSSVISSTQPATPSCISATVYWSAAPLSAWSSALF
ncbi:hypothetical protein V3481_006618 [Fusarium oxysporum f. sp. vasinfectum]